MLLEVLRLGEQAYGRAILKAVQSRLERERLRVPFTRRSNGSSVRACSRLAWDQGPLFVPGVSAGFTASTLRAYVPSMRRAGPSTTFGAA